MAHLRKTETDYSQESLAHAAKLHRTYMGLIERGKANPTLDMVDKLARALKVPPERLFIDPESRR